MRVLTAAQMREADRRTVELGIPGLILMENAGHRVVELLVEKFSPLEDQRIVVLCGKGNNGGDGLVVARQLYTRFHPLSLDVVLAAEAEELQGDAAENYRMLRATGCGATLEIAPRMRFATIVVDALLGTGLQGPPKGRAAGLIHEINTGFPLAKVVAVDVPSGFDSDSGRIPGEAARADYTVTFTAPKPCHVLSPACDAAGELRVGAIGSPPELLNSSMLSLVEPVEFAHLFKPRPRESNKGLYGHVLAIAGSSGKTGAAAMAGVAALRAGAGLSTVASDASAITAIAAHAPEIMTEALQEDFAGLKQILEGKNAAAIGPGMGKHPDTVAFIRRVVNELSLPLVVDADGLNALAGAAFETPAPRVFTPHPGEMSRLCGKSVSEVQANRVGIAREFAQQHHVHLVLKGNRTVIAFPDGQVWINPTGSPSMATGGTGDVLTGLIAGLIAQFPKDLEKAILAAVWLHGRAGELGAAALGEKAMIATDLFDFLPEAMREAAGVSHRV